MLVCEVLFVGIHVWKYVNNLNQCDCCWGGTLNPRPSPDLGRSLLFAFPAGAEGQQRPGVGQGVLWGTPESCVCPPITTVLRSVPGAVVGSRGRAGRAAGIGKEQRGRTKRCEWIPAMPLQRRTREIIKK